MVGLNIKYELQGLLDKYRKKVREMMDDPDTNSDAEAEQHTEYIDRCARGDIVARNYVINKVDMCLRTLLTKEDNSKAKEIIIDKFNIMKEKKYDGIDLDAINFHEEEAFITYEQLLDLFGDEEQKSFLEKDERQLDITRMLAYEIYKIEYGSDLLEDLMYMAINNIEVMGTRKIRVETSKGLWYTLKEYRFEDEETIQNIARKLYNQEGNNDITDDECEKEGMLLNGARLTIVLKKGGIEHYIWIKKFDAFNPTMDQMLQYKTVTPRMLQDLKVLAKGRSNNGIIGGINVGKSAFGKAYIELFPKHYKIGILDSSKDNDIRELYPDRDIIILHESETYSLNDQFSKLLRSNRHILIITEGRSFEIEQMIKAQTRANAGSYCTLHVTTIEDYVNNVAWMCLENGQNVDIRVLIQRIAMATDIVIRLRHIEDTGIRVVDDISEIVATGNLDKPYEIRNMYYWDDINKTTVKNKNYKLSEGFEAKLKYYGCSDEEIETLKRVD